MQLVKKNTFSPATAITGNQVTVVTTGTTTTR